MEAIREAHSLQRKCLHAPTWVWLEYYMRGVRFSLYRETEDSYARDVLLRERLILISDAEYSKEIAADAYAAGEVYSNPHVRMKAFFDSVPEGKGG
jgi:hypothetical protein